VFLTTSLLDIIPCKDYNNYILHRKVGGFVSEYISTSEAAKKWGLSRRRTTTLCSEGRVPNAIFVGDRWLIPTDTEKPVDARIKSGKYIKKADKEK